MTAPKNKSEVLSETAKSYLKEIAKQDFYGYESYLDNKYVQKGIEVENESIELYNSVFFTSYEKNIERKNNDFLTGEADIVGDNVIIDIKSSWSLDTFPATEKDINLKDYEMQLRGYMMLYDKEHAEISYCMVSTPNLPAWENKQIHEVDHIDPRYRVTTIQIKRDLEIEKEIEEKCKHAIQFYSNYTKKLECKNV
jgi:hypothetical protein